MPKVKSATCNKKLPVGARCVKNAFPEKSPRKGYFVTGKAPVVKVTRGSAKGCVRAARPSEGKRIRQAHRVQNKSVKKSVKKSGKKSARRYVLFTGRNKGLPKMSLKKAKMISDAFVYDGNGKLLRHADGRAIFRHDLK
jgi:hypothetical protein